MFSGAAPFTPGMWHSEATFKLNGVPMPSTDDDNCVSAKEAKEPKEAIAESLKRNDCTLTEWKMKKSTVNAVVNCKNDQLEAQGILKGHFDKKSYNLAGDITGKHKFLGKARASVVFDGRWTGECRPEKKEVK